jgi:hypothetical protein
MAEQPGRPTGSTLPLPPEVDAVFRSVHEQLRVFTEIVDRPAAPVEQITQAFAPVADLVARMPRPTIDLPAINFPTVDFSPIEFPEQINQVCAWINAMAARMPRPPVELPAVVVRLAETIGRAYEPVARQLANIVVQPPWSMVSKSPEEAGELWELLVTEWPPDTLISEIARFINALDRLLTAESDADLEATARALARYDAFLTPYFKHRGVRRVLAGRARRMGRSAARAWVADEVFTPILVDLMRGGEVYRPQRIRLGRTWVKVTGGWHRPTRESAPVFYRPGTIAQLEPMQLRLVRFCRWLRNRTHKLAEAWIISTELPARTTAESEIIGRSRPEPASDDGAYVLAACQPTVPERQTMDATAQLEADETLHEYLASLSPRTRALVLLREVEGLPYREVARRLGYSTEVAALVARHRVRPKRV